MAAAISTVPQIAIPHTAKAALSPKLVLALRGTLDRMFDPYRPERHYMRGPGPKWRAKHGLDAQA